MKQTIVGIALVVTLLFAFIACDNKEVLPSKNGGVELFLLDSYRTIGSTVHIDETTVVTKSKPLVSFADFLSYDPNTFTFKISDTAKEAIKSLQLSVHGTAFAIKANNALIYTGYLWPAYSSASCDWVTIDPSTLYIGNELIVQMGYPGLSEGQVISDKRNDQRILDIFTSDNKLIK